MKERLKEIRLALKLSQEEFGNRIHIKRSHVSSLESGTRNLTERVMHDICRAYNVNEKWLISGEGQMFNQFENIVEAANEGRLSLSEADERFIRAFINLKEEQRESLRNSLQAFLSLWRNENEI